jgi:hypothetical protein
VAYVLRSINEEPLSMNQPALSWREAPMPADRVIDPNESLNSVLSAAFAVVSEIAPCALRKYRTKRMPPYREAFSSLFFSVSAYSRPSPTGTRLQSLRTRTKTIIMTIRESARDQLNISEYSLNADQLASYKCIVAQEL